MSRGVKIINNFDFDSAIEISLCSRNAEEFHIPKDTKARFSSQYELSRLIEEADVIIPFI